MNPIAQIANEEKQEKEKRVKKRSSYMFDLPNRFHKNQKSLIYQKDILDE